MLKEKHWTEVDSKRRSGVQGREKKPLPDLLQQSKTKPGRAQHDKGSALSKGHQVISGYRNIAE